MKKQQIVMEMLLFCFFNLLFENDFVEDFLALFDFDAFFELIDTDEKIWISDFFSING